MTHPCYICCGKNYRKKGAFRGAVLFGAISMKLNPGSREWCRWFYKSTAWKHKRKHILRRDNYECQKCKREGRYSKATDVHHVKRLDNHPEFALTDDNLESLCPACHNREHPEKLKPPAVKVRENLTPERW